MELTEQEIRQMVEEKCREALAPLYAQLEQLKNEKNNDYDKDEKH